MKKSNQHILYCEENKFKSRENSFTQDIPTFDELVIKNTLVKKLDHFPFYGRSSPASKANLIIRRHNLSLQSTFPIKIYQPEEDPTVGQISDKDVQCFLCSVVSILNYEREIN